MYRSVLQIRSPPFPPSCISPSCIFSASLAEVYPVHKPLPHPEEDSSHSRKATRLSTVKVSTMNMDHPAPTSMMDTPATSWKRPTSSPLNAETRQPTASVGSISLPRAWPPPSTMRSRFAGREGVIAREIVASCV